MKFHLLLIAIVALAFSSCSSVYKSGQTPDDVYYSPVRVVNDDDDIDNDRKDEDLVNDRQEERQIRMASHDRRWRVFDDDYNYRYDPYRYGYGYGYYYNPYYCQYPVYIKGGTIINPKTTIPRQTNLGTYTQNTTVIYNNKTGNVVQANRRYKSTNNEKGGFIRSVILPSIGSSSEAGSSNSSSGNNSRTYSPSRNSSSGSSSGSSSSGSSRPVSRPGRN